MKIFAFLTLFLILEASAHARECVPQIDSCSYYICAEDRHSCGPKGYPLGFGFRFCGVFLNTEDTYSERGRAWLQDVRLCLMNALENVTEEKNCKILREKAFAQHIDCYLSTGFCELKGFEKMRILWGLRQSFLQKAVVKDAWAVAKACAAKRAPSPEDPGAPK